MQALRHGLRYRDPMESNIGVRDCSQTSLVSMLSVPAQDFGDDGSILFTCELIQLYILNPSFSCRNVNITFVSFRCPGYLSRSCKLDEIS